MQKGNLVRVVNCIEAKEEGIRGRVFKCLEDPKEGRVQVEGLGKYNIKYLEEV